MEKIPRVVRDVNGSEVKRAGVRGQKLVFELYN